MAFMSVFPQLCASHREFTVDNCTDCPMMDFVLGAQRATCDESGNDTYTCVCTTCKVAGLRYYPKTEGNITRCTASWTTAPELYTVITLASVAVMLYATMHFFYLAIRARICCCPRRGCKKISVAALMFGIFGIFYSVMPLYEMALQGGIPLKKRWVGYGGLILNMFALVSNFIGQVFMLSSFSDVAYPGEDKACCRRGILIASWIICGLSSLATVIGTLMTVINTNGEHTQGETNIKAVGFVFITIMVVYPCVFMVTAHKAMHEVVIKHDGAQTKPPLIVKMINLCKAICRFFYPAQIVYLASFAGVIAQSLCLGDLGSESYWLTHAFTNTMMGISGSLIASLFEGQRVPTYPCCLCRKRKDIFHISGLQFTSTLGEALRLLVKHGLDARRQQESPVEVATESLESTAPLEVAAGPDMDLLGCIEHFLHNCADDKDCRQSVSQILRAGNHNLLCPHDIFLLRNTTTKCLQWAKDPARPPIADTTFDEAAAIQLYTQETCVYRKLNAALRDHTHPEKLEAFLPYLKLLLKGLNKLPLIRARVSRGVRLDLHEVYNKLQGKVFTWWAFSSTTMDKKVLSNAAFLGDEGDRTLFSIDAIGVNIAAFSAHPSEQELLLLPGTLLTMEPGVEVEPHFWKFEASVYEAALRQTVSPRHAEQEEENDEHGQEDGKGEEEEEPTDGDGEVVKEAVDEKEHEPDSVLPVGADVSDGQIAASEVQFQIDVSHEQIAASEVQFQNTDLGHPDWALVLYGGSDSPYV